MTWNWQHGDWPRFTWDERKLSYAESTFAQGAGIAIGASKHLNADDRETLGIELMSREAMDTSAIEGETLDRDSVQSSIRKHLGLATDNRRARPAEAGIAEMMIDLYEHASSPLVAATLHRWHGLITNGRRDLKDMGRYRTHADPMRIVSGAVHAPKVHFEAPPSSRVETEMTRFWDWLAAGDPKGAAPIAPLARAGIAHIWFESIHPYEDGNGRVGRAVSEKILAQGFTTPVITGLSAPLLKHRKAYYAALERAHRGLEITDWLLWFAAKAIEAQRHTVVRVEFVLEKTRVMQRVRGQINARQERALIRMFDAGPEGFTGGLSAANYMRITAASPATATRDLVGLVAMGALARTGENKAARYHLVIPAMRPVSFEVGDVL